MHLVRPLLDPAPAMGALCRRTAAQRAVLAVMLERQLAKNRIPELYLKRVHFGYGLDGAEAISRGVPGCAAAKPRACDTVRHQRHTGDTSSRASYG